MKADDSGIQTHYIDALGKRHESSPAALDAIRAAMADDRRTPGKAARATNFERPPPHRMHGASSRSTR